MDDSEFSNTSAAIWNGIQTAIQKAGFIISNVTSLDKGQGSFNAQTSPNPKPPLINLVISSYKPHRISTKNQTTSKSIGSSLGFL